VATGAAVTTSLSFVLGIGGPARVTTHDAKGSARTAVSTTADTSPVFTSDYSGGHLFTADPDGGYWTVNWVGAVSAQDGAPTFGSPVTSGIKVSKPVVAMAATSDGQGYWLVGSDGGVFTYGDAKFYGSTGSIHLNQPIVGMAATPDGAGYWLVAADGGVFTFGDAQFYGSTGSIHLNQPIVGMAATPDDAGYWLIASDGGIFTFGDAKFSGSLADAGGSVLGAVVDPATPGYTLVQSTGSASVFPSGQVIPAAQVIPSGPGSSFTTEPTVATVQPDAASVTDDCQPQSTPSATADTALTSTFATKYGPGWLGGDGSYSTALPNGNEAFDFSDTLIGTAQANGESTLAGMVHNSELVGPLSDMTTDIGGTTSAPQILIPDTITPADQWEVGGTDVENGEQLIFLNEFGADGGAKLLFDGHSGIAVMSIPADGVPALTGVVPVPTDPDTEWGNAVMQSGGYNYIYGADINLSLDKFYGMKVARVPLGQSLDTAAWRYWNGSAWVVGESNAVPVFSVTVLTGVAPQPSGNGYVAVSIPGWSGGDTTVDLSYACAPSGPWTAPKAVYTIPQVTEYPGEFAYTPTFHPELSNQGGLVVSYNVNSVATLNILKQDVHLYQPRFIQVQIGS
jgi:hypothetical protein